MLHWLKRHPISIAAHFDFSLVLTYAYPRDLLEPLLTPGLDLEVYEGYGFLAIALVATRELRPAALPRWMGRRFFLSGYRIFVRFETRAGRRLRGLKILRSDTNRATMALFGNLLTHYNYELSQIRWQRRDDYLGINVATRNAAADLDVRANLASRPAPLPSGSPFPDLHTARLFAGPLPFTFDYERQTHSIIRIEGVRTNWQPQPVSVEVRRATFLERAPFDAGGAPLLANAFYLEDVPYCWKRGVRESLRR
jgi:hypothetical protein